MILASQGGSVPEFLREPIANRDLPGGGGRVGYASLSRVMFYMPLTGQKFFNHVGTFWLEKWLNKLIMVLFPLTSQWLWSTSPSFIIYCLTSDDLGNKQGS